MEDEEEDDRGEPVAAPAAAPAVAAVELRGFVGVDVDDLGFRGLGVVDDA